MEQPVLAGSEALHVLLAMAKSPEIVGVCNVTAAAPVFEIVMTCVAEV
jgi:hypothetical protein